MNENPDKKVEASRSEVTRERLLAAALDVFGRYGFDGASTRKLADAAGVNLQAIPYYFGSKEGLYVATADHLAGIVAGHVAGIRHRVGRHLAQIDATNTPLNASQARLFLTEIVETMIVLFVSKESEAWARFIIREQLEPTAAFERVYAGIMGPVINMARRLIGTILKEDPASENMRLRTLSFVGSLLVFRMANAAVLAQMEWNSIGEEQIATLRAHARSLVALLEPAKGETE
ncbi:TetR family transcriptional regulator protein (plasmid) [Rhizobium etli 8C-3]|uniref:TetR family transcriptional regulator protein n=2 Tax=Rhizobium TaxID=379 RepID=A0A1L5PFJ6_RHIET|nr:MULTISPECIES: CerR family C-terminal domain-containing protein [Rhizobium]APO78903.1 TetR family transcriptional regulator protein [Rhizobium etli 8C-3]TCU33864.1 TetR family transcriptional regulator [Rhizobium azibense]